MYWIEAENSPVRISSKMGWGMKVSEGTRKGGVIEGCVLGLVEEGMEGWLVFMGLSGCFPGKVRGLQVYL